MRTSRGNTLARLFILAISPLSCVACGLSLLDMKQDAGASREHNIGINLFASHIDWVEDRLFADVMKTAREWTAPGQYGEGPLVGVDVNGWPTVDAEVVVWHGIYRMNGTYRLSGRSAAAPTVTLGHGGGTLENFRYSNGAFSADVVYGSTGNDGLLLTFTGTGGGVRDVKLMRPRAPGSSSSYSASELFTSQAKALVSKFDAIRFMWATDCWNAGWQVGWGDRVRPDYCSFNRVPSDAADPENLVSWAGYGMAWEYAVWFCNETGKDMWLNMPLGADDEYIRSLARLVRDTYTVPDGKVYWEYSNEATWDMEGRCSAYLREKGLAEAAAAGPVGYEGDGEINDNPDIMAARYYIKRAAEMSLLWREVWGDDAMMARVRPIACGMLGYDGELIWGLEFLHNYYNNADGQHVADPRPVNYFFYGSGASHYTGDPSRPVDDPDAPFLPRYDDTVRPCSEIESFERRVEQEACLAKIFGLERCAYEGGLWTEASNYRLPRITSAMARYHDLWDKYDSDLLVYYVSTGGEDDGTALGFTQSAHDLDTRKFAAVDYILARDKAAPTGGLLAPGSIEPADYSVGNDPSMHPAPAGDVTVGEMEFNEWSTFKGYLFRTETSGRYTVRLTFRETEGATLEVMVDGALLAREDVRGCSASYSLMLDAGLHGLRIKKLDDGSFFLEGIRVD